MKAIPAGIVSPVTLLRVVIVACLLGAWQALSASGLLYSDVVPSLGAIAGAMLSTLVDPEFYGGLRVTAFEIGLGLGIGASLGLVSGLVLGSNRFLGRAFEPYLYYLGPTPKIIFFPIMIMWFGVGPGSKIGMGAFSCFFPVALSVAAGMRGIAPILIKVGQSLRAHPVQMVTKIYLPALREPILTGVRLGLGVATAGTLLAETKLSNQGLGFLVIQDYQQFDMPSMYALLIIIFVLAIALNALIGRIARRGGAGKRR
jgi:ABC-type nitrate/sulfonate/bicarbonate transport system permease component